MRWLPLVLLFTGCNTDEVRGWQARRTDLEARVAQLAVVNDALPTLTAARENVARLRAELQLTERVRVEHLAAQVFVEPGHQRVVISGTVESCRATLSGLSAMRWLLPTWRLRVDGPRCEVELKTGEAFTALEDALLVSPPRWTPPPAQALSRDLSMLKQQVHDLEVRISEDERRLGDAAWLTELDRRLEAIAPKLDAARAAQQPCIAWVLERELALDEADRGQVLELTNERLIHPLEPKSDRRLRGLLELNDGRLTWRCQEQ